MKFNGIDFDTYHREYPNEAGYFGKYGGAYLTPELKQGQHLSHTAKDFQTNMATSKYMLNVRI